MLVSLVITMTPIATPAQPTQSGSAVHGWFLRAVQVIDDEMSSALHRANEVRPFTVSEVWHGTSPPRRVERFVAGEVYWLRVTCVKEQLSTLLGECLAKLPSVLEFVFGELFGQRLQRKIRLTQ